MSSTTSSSVSPSAAAAASSTPPAGMACVYYDGGCPLCRAEIATYQRAEGAAALRFVDAHACPAEELGAELERAAALARLHVRRADGRLVQGAGAFVEIWSALPRWAWLARLARVPGVLPLLDLGYGAFLRVRPLWRRRVLAADGLPPALRRELRTDHAGETGAVMIYRGVLAVSRDPQLRAFAQHHLATEQRHLSLIEDVLPPRGRSWLLPLWRLSGWLTGALPALAGPRAVYATIQAVETFVDRHYAAQVAAIDEVLQPRGGGPMPDTPVRTQAPSPTQTLAALREVLEACRLDEVAHRDDAAGRWDGRTSVPLALWQAVVGRGSAAAVGVCRWI